MNNFTRAQAQALRQLAELWPDGLCLIGASALACQIDLPRHTGDLDISVSVSLDELAAGLGRLDGWKRNPRKEHEWLSATGVKVDVLPAGPTLLAAGEIVWPATGVRMNLTGMRLALATANRIEIESGFSIRVAPVPVIAVLKMISYLDRPAERERDLHDLAHILDKHVAPGDDRRFAPAVLDAGVAMSTPVPTFLVGISGSSRTRESEPQSSSSLRRCVTSGIHLRPKEGWLGWGHLRGITTRMTSTASERCSTSSRGWTAHPSTNALIALGASRIDAGRMGEFLLCPGGASALQGSQHLECVRRQPLLVWRAAQV